MKNRLLQTTGLAMLLMAGATQVMADEAWDTNVGRMIYADEIGPTAVFSYGKAEDPGVVYLLGLAKVYEGRTRYDGYWARNKAKVECKTERPGIYGKMTKYWGRFEIRFIDSGFPARWEATWSYCDGEAQATKIAATPLTAQQSAAPR